MYEPHVVSCYRYLDNVVERDRRATKRRCASMLELKSFRTVAVTLVMRGAEGCSPRCARRTRMSSDSRGVGSVAGLVARTATMSSS